MGNLLANTFFPQRKHKLTSTPLQTFYEHTQLGLPVKGRLTVSQSA